VARRCARAPIGFSLIELLTTLAVLAIVLSAGVPGVRQFIADHRRAAQTNYLVSALTRAREEAMSSSRMVSVCPSRDGLSCTSGTMGWQSGFIVFADADRSSLGRVDRADEILETYVPPRGRFTLRGSPPIAHFVAFSPTGTAFRGGEFIWCDSRGPKFARAVIVRRSGNALVSSSSASGQPLTCTP
jgi:type IV fimbrial biogenesis protein FimT